MTEYKNKEESQFSAGKDFELKLKKAVVWDDAYGLLFLQDKEVLTFLLETILQKPDIEIAEKIEIKKPLSYLKHPISFGVLAQDTKGRVYEIEIEKEKESQEAITAKMAFYLGALTVNSFKDQNGQGPPSITSIFVIKPGSQNTEEPETIYELFDSPKETEEKQDFQLRGILVNGALQNQTRLGKLMHDFSTADPDKMLLPILREKSKFYKEKKEGRREMEGLFGDLIKEREREAELRGEMRGIKKGEKKGEKKGAKKERKKFVLALLKKGSTPLEEISEISGFSLEKLEKLKAEMEY